MPDIILTTLNAKYAHCAFGLRYLLANLGALQPRAKILEFDIHHRTTDVLEKILAHDPKIVGVGVYIWNATQSLQLVGELKRLRPDITIILGGPEVSYETEQQEITRHADYVITGEADLAFAELCQQLVAANFVAADVRKQSVSFLSTEVPPPHVSGYSSAKILPAPLPVFNQLQLPYDLYTDEDIAHRVLYVEASRGCPFECEFCLSSLDIPVRNAALDKFLAAMQSLLDRGARQFKFVDRTFNLNLQFSRAILEFFLERYRDGMFLHFEMIPDRLPDPLRAIIEKFPRGALQFEVGIQTFNEEVAKLISRRQNNAKVEENLTWLREKTGVYVHTDLIGGLPGEDIASFALGFNRLVALRPHEIQIELLKRLRGTPIVRHDRDWQMIYSPHPPYEVMQTRLINFPTMQRLRRFARYWDLIANSGNFVTTTPLLLREAPFENFMRLSDWIFTTTKQTHAIALPRLSELLFRFLVEEQKMSASVVSESLVADYQRGGRKDLPAYLRNGEQSSRGNTPLTRNSPPRQSRQLEKRS
jgi:radical SAM superfamily enzyme YgiQ (UPF0313 family)